MYQFFDSIANIFSTIINFVISAVESILMVVNLIAKSFVSVGLVTSYLPDILKVFVGVVICYCVVINVLNKGG